MKSIDYDEQLDIIENKILKALEENFIKSIGLSCTKVKKTLCDFGYKLKEVRIELKEIDADLPYLKWGFEESEYKVKFLHSFEEVFLIADRKSMDKIVEKTIRESDAYVQAIISKLKLINATHFSGHDDIFCISWNEDCISSSKENSVAFIYLVPRIKAYSEGKELS